VLVCADVGCVQCVLWVCVFVRCVCMRARVRVCGACLCVACTCESVPVHLRIWMVMFIPSRHNSMTAAALAAGL